MSETEYTANDRDETPTDTDSGDGANGDGIVRDARTLRVTVESVDDFFDRVGSKFERLEDGEIDALPERGG